MGIDSDTFCSDDDVAVVVVVGVVVVVVVDVVVAVVGVVVGVVVGIVVEVVDDERGGIGEVVVRVGIVDKIKDDCVGVGDAVGVEAGVGITGVLGVEGELAGCTHAILFPSSKHNKCMRLPHISQR
jgi:hypothetical protein